ncbi:MAG: hypothetical protein JWQ96_1919 [Segetibacter sp.]|nr:hypothetical protein [Segetibacter sp.]
MNEEKFNNEAGRRWGRSDNANGNRWTGVFLLIIGALLLAKTSGVLFPVWFFTWPVLLIGIGLYLGVRHNFRRSAWFILIIIGSVFLADRIIDDINLRPYLWPAIIMAAGLFIILKPKSARSCKNMGNKRDRDESYSFQPVQDGGSAGSEGKSFNDHNEVIDITAIFGGIKKNVVSKNFRGGDVVAMMGGAEINLSQADFNGKIKIDIFNMFGGTKLIVPPDWDVQSEIVALFGGVDDKRQPSNRTDPNKVIFLEGTCVFGGIEIRSY